jgi:hypothetical protein
VKRYLARAIALYLVIAGLAGALASPVANAAGGPFYALSALPMPSGTDGWLIGTAGIDDAGDVAASAVDTGNFQHVLVWPHGGSAEIQPVDYGVFQNLTHDGVLLYWNNHDGQLHQYTIATSSDSLVVSVLTGVRAMNAASPRMTVGNYLPENSQVPAAGEAPLGSNNINQITDLGFGIDSGVAAINDAGDVAGFGNCTTSTNCAYLYDHTTHSAIVIGPDGSDASATMQATGINESGEVIGQSFSNFGFNRPPFIYTKSGGLVFLHTGTFGTGSASGINYLGNVVGEIGESAATLWPSGSIDPIDLNTRVVQTDLTNWHLDGAAGINDNGLILASGTLNGRSQAFLLTPVEDGVPPTTTGTIVDGSGALATPNGAGWYNDDTLKLHVQVADNDGGFGLGTLTVSVNGNSSTRTVNRKGQSLDAVTFTEGTTSVSYYATDLAGNQEIAHSLTVKYDKTAPTWACDDVPSGWVRGDLTLSCHASDAVSGLDPNSPATFTLATSLGPDAESANVATNTRTLCDVAGNCVDAHLTGLMIDNKAPIVSGAPTSAPNGNNWYNTPVEIHWNCTDGGSGVTACPNDQSIETEGTTQTVTQTVSDNAGNSTTATSSPAVNIDLTAPTVSYSGNQGNYQVDQIVTIHCSASDNLSGIASSTCADISGPAYSFAAGTNQFSATATDYAGNTGSSSVSFTISVTPESLCALTKQFIGNSRAATPLCAPLNALTVSQSQHNDQMKAALINTYIMLVNAQRSLTNQERTTLVQLAHDL